MATLGVANVSNKIGALVFAPVSAPIIGASVVTLGPGEESEGRASPLAGMEGKTGAEPARRGEEDAGDKELKAAVLSGKAAGTGTAVTDGVVSRGDRLLAERLSPVGLGPGKEAAGNTGARNGSVPCATVSGDPLALCGMMFGVSVDRGSSDRASAGTGVPERLGFPEGTSGAIERETGAGPGKGAGGA
jgi:hypothetical protein